MLLMNITRKSVLWLQILPRMPKIGVVFPSSTRFIIGPTLNNHIEACGLWPRENFALIINLAFWYCGYSLDQKEKKRNLRVNNRFHFIDIWHLSRKQWNFLSLKRCRHNAFPRHNLSLFCSEELVKQYIRNLIWILLTAGGSQWRGICTWLSY